MGDAKKLTWRSPHGSRSCSQQWQHSAAQRRSCCSPTTRGLPLPWSLRGAAGAEGLPKYTTLLIPSTSTFSRSLLSVTTITFPASPSLSPYQLTQQDVWGTPLYW